MAQNLGELLNAVIQQESPKLRSISESDAAARAGAGDGWSRKQELGHLLDSATNNRVRFVTAALNRTYAGPTYNGDGWVALGGYAEASWADLVELWTRLNEGLVRVVENIPGEALTAQCKVGDGEPVSLQFLIEDYVRHMQHHLRHILAHG